ncbi:TPA: hypothetical protein I7E53_004034 [Vibrio cholerae]|nr:hypothetical protein [Vibrio cholerae]HAS5616689.1 hypothetical protein [Vibrio cholerae]HAS5623885.1 hypothetical protein [Vibrio cholerae]HAS5624406.1 hypothetical protein [Vibrio cholerae]
MKSEIDSHIRGAKYILAFKARAIAFYAETSFRIQLKYQSCLNTIAGLYGFNDHRCVMDTLKKCSPKQTREMFFSAFFNKKKLHDNFKLWLPELTENQISMLVEVAVKTNDLSLFYPMIETNDMNKIGTDVVAVRRSIFDDMVDILQSRPFFLEHYPYIGNLVPKEVSPRRYVSIPLPKIKNSEGETLGTEIKFFIKLDQSGQGELVSTELALSSGSENGFDIWLDDINSKATNDNQFLSEFAHLRKRQKPASLAKYKDEKQYGYLFFQSPRGSVLSVDTNLKPSFKCTQLAQYNGMIPLNLAIEAVEQLTLMFKSFL